jgi:hypothetical protein
MSQIEIIKTNSIRVARWFIFKTKILIWVILECLAIVEGIFNGHLVYFRATWYILGPFGVF